MKKKVKRKIALIKAKKKNKRTYHDKEYDGFSREEIDFRFWKEIEGMDGGIYRHIGFKKNKDGVKIPIYVDKVYADSFLLPSAH